MMQQRRRFDTDLNRSRQKHLVGNALCHRRDSPAVIEQRHVVWRAGTEFRRHGYFLYRGTPRIFLCCPWLAAPRYPFSGMIMSTTREGCARSWYTVWLALTSRVSPATGPPVLGLRSNLGKLPLEISTRIRWPFKNTLLVTPASTATV